MPDSGPKDTLLLLHGFGENETRFASALPLLGDHFRTQIPRGPVELGPDRCAWADVAFTPKGPRDDFRQIEESRKALLSIVEEAASSGRVYLFGFSQGGTMAFSLLATRPDLLAGVVAVSGLLLEQYLPSAGSTAFDGLPVFVAHGTEDKLVPVARARESRDRLASLPVALTYREYATGHEPGEKTLRDAAVWLKGLPNGRGGA